MMNYLAGKIKYPESAREEGLEGTVYVTFVVEKDGSVNNVRVLRGFDEECDKVALDAVMSMPKWDPGKEKGEPVRVQFNVPVKFNLDKEKEVKDGNDKTAQPPPPKKEKK
jgi:protein TonB